MMNTDRPLSQPIHCKTTLNEGNLHTEMTSPWLFRILASISCVSGPFARSSPV